MYKAIITFSITILTCITLSWCATSKRTESSEAITTTIIDSNSWSIESWIMETGTTLLAPNGQSKPIVTSIKPGQRVDKSTACGLADGEYPNQLSINWPGNYKITSIWAHGLWFIKKWTTLFYVVNVSNEYDETTEIHLYKYNCTTKKSIPLNKENLVRSVYSKWAILWSNSEWFFFQIYIGDSYGTWNDSMVSYQDEKIKDFDISTLAWYAKIQEKYSGLNDIYCHLKTIKSISCMAQEEWSDDPITKTFTFNPYTLSIDG